MRLSPSICPQSGDRPAACRHCEADTENDTQFSLGKGFIISLTHTQSEYKGNRESRQCAELVGLSNAWFPQCHELEASLSTTAHKLWTFRTAEFICSFRNYLLGTLSMAGTEWGLKRQEWLKWKQSLPLQALQDYWAVCTLYPSQTMGVMTDNTQCCERGSLRGHWRTYKRYLSWIYEKRKSEKAS